MPKVVDKEEMRNAILDAALRVFADKGYHATSVSTVAHAAGLAKGTLYIYFESKESLISAAVEREFAGVSAEILRDEPSKTLAEFLEKLRATMDVSAEQAALYRVFFEVFGPSFASAAFTAKIARFFDRIGAYYARQISFLQDNGEVADHHDATAVGRVLASMLDGVVLHRGLFAISSRRHRRMIGEALTVLGAGLQSKQPKPNQP